MLNELQVTLAGQVFLKTLLSCHLCRNEHQGINYQQTAASPVLGKSR